MAQKGVQIDPNKFSCSICLDLLKDPVTIPCGHSYCMNCIKDHRGAEAQRRIYSCPTCRKNFKKKHGLVKNIMLAELVEELKETELGADPADLCYAGPEDVSCDVCSGRKRKAVNSCLDCPASFCEEHLQPHHDASPLKRHKLVNPSKNLQENICSRHDEVMQIFCRTDQQCICFRCLMDEHKGHETVLVTAERAEKQEELEESRQQIQQRIQDREKDVELLQQKVEDINVSAEKTVKDSEMIIAQLILLFKRSSDVKQQVRSQQEAEVSRVKELQEKLEQEITELKRKDAELEQLSHTEDHKQFLHNYSPVSLSESPHSSSINIGPLRPFEDVTAAVTELRDKLQDVLRDKSTNVSLGGTGVDGLLSEPESEPKTRAGFLKCFKKITLDPNTANRCVLLSDENRKATLTEDQSYPDHPDRFTVWWQVLSRETLTGRCYWEVEWRGKVYVSVAYKNIDRVGKSVQCLFGYNDKSWSFCCDKDLSFLHNKVKTPVSGRPSSRVGVFLDHSAGTLSFYSVSKTMTLLHRVQTSFTQPLYAGVRLSNCGNTAEFIQLKQK